MQDDINMYGTHDRLNNASFRQKLNIKNITKIILQNSKST